MARIDEDRYVGSKVSLLRHIFGLSLPDRRQPAPRALRRSPGAWGEENASSVQHGLVSFYTHLLMSGENL